LCVRPAAGTAALRDPQGYRATDKRHSGLSLSTPESNRATPEFNHPNITGGSLTHLYSTVPRDRGGANLGLPPVALYEISVLGVIRMERDARNIVEDFGETHETQLAGVYSAWLTRVAYYVVPNLGGTLHRESGYFYRHRQPREHSMRNSCAIAVAAAFLATSAFAAESDGPLTPGKPAGVRQAQYADNTALYVVGIGILAAGIAIAASSGGGSHNNSGGGSSTVTTTSTSP
jgi:hypothetical protein